MIESPAFLELPAQAKALIPLLQIHWRPDKPVDYGVEEARKKIPCDKRTARKAFDRLAADGFVDKVDESFFSSRTGSKTRTWRLNWMPWLDKRPTDEWVRKWEQKNESTGGIMHPVTHPQGAKIPRSKIGDASRGCKNPPHNKEGKTAQKVHKSPTPTVTIPSTNFPPTETRPPEA
ncbi:MAG: hypothetical protein LBV29_02575 [Azoarcus sp.]|jgi:hypothetical protein|nr:hypothetical protein [Azoarcus sp.]